MSIASFHKKVFQVSSTRKYPLSGLGWSGALETESQEKLKDKPSTYIKGIGLIALSFEVPLRADFGINVRNEIEQWEAIRDQSTPDYFILGTKPIAKNKLLLKSVAISETEVDGHGRLLKALLKLDFEEYVRAGKATSTKAKTAKGGAAVNIGLTPTDDILNPPNKAESKRNNPSKQDALQRVARMDRLYGEGRA